MVGSPTSLRGSGASDASGPIPVRPGAKALLTDSGRALLVEERHADGSTFWTLPGGGLAPGETAREALRRELDEELNCRPALDEEVARFWYAHHSNGNVLTRYAVFAARGVADVTPSPHEGILDVDWFGPSECPSTTLPQVRYLVDDQVARRPALGPEGGRSVASRAKSGIPIRTNR